jgi:hypothetical protein
VNRRQLLKLGALGALAPGPRLQPPGPAPVPALPPEGYYKVVVGIDWGASASSDVYTFFDRDGRCLGSVTAAELEDRG